MEVTKWLKPSDILIDHKEIRVLALLSPAAAPFSYKGASSRPPIVLTSSEAR